MPAVDIEPVPGAPRKLSRLRLHRRDSIGLAYHVLTFETDTPLQARAGQFVMMRTATSGPSPLLPRPMSLLAAGERPAILLKVVGEATERFARASSGELFDVLLPLGTPWGPCPEGHRRLLIAGGVGVAPILFLARELSERSALLPLALFGGRTASDLPLSAELASVAALRVATEDGSAGTRGRVTVLAERVLCELAKEAIPAKVYTCGPRLMMASIAQMCRSAGVRCEVSLEARMACGYGVCLGCAVPRRSPRSSDEGEGTLSRPSGYIYACTEGPCVDAESVDWPGELSESAAQAREA